VEKTYEFSQFLVKVLGVSDMGAIFEEKVTYHPSCHAMRLLGVKEEPMQLLENVKGVEFVELSHKEDCCGFGGTFAVKMADMSEAMVCEKAKHVVETGATVLVGTDMGCLMNIDGRLNKEGKPIRVMHLAELLEKGVMKGEQCTNK
jgi:L-lactate dehydrogenase complex protein LldE